MIDQNEWLSSLLNPDHGLFVERFGLTRVAPEWMLEDRVINEHYLTFVTENANWAEVDGQSVRLEANSLFYVAPGVPHSMHAADHSAPHRFFHLRFELRSDERNTSFPQRFLMMPQASVLREKVEDLFSEYQTKGLHTDLRFRALLADVFIVLFRSAESQQPTRGNQLSQAQQLTLHRYVDDQLHRAIQPAELAELLGYSRDYFTRLFRRTFGFAPRTWLMHERIRHAAMYLSESALPVSEIAGRFGYEDLFLFSRQFKQVMGVSPREYKRRH